MPSILFMRLYIFVFWQGGILYKYNQRKDDVEVRKVLFQTTGHEFCPWEHMTLSLQDGSCHLADDYPHSFTRARKSTSRCPAGKHQGRVLTFQVIDRWRHLVVIWQEHFSSFSNLLENDYVDILDFCTRNDTNLVVIRMWGCLLVIEFVSNQSQERKIALQATWKEDNLRSSFSD